MSDVAWETVPEDTAAARALAAAVADTIAQRPARERREPDPALLAQLREGGRLP